MVSCFCGYEARCTLSVALHMLLVHGHYDIAMGKGYKPVCMACLYGSLEPYTVMVTADGFLVGAAKVGGTCMQVPNGRGPQNGVVTLLGGEEL